MSTATVMKHKTWVEVLLAFRPKTLTAALVPCLVGSAYSYRVLAFYKPWIFWCALLSAFCIQIGTNLFNDAMDFKKGTDTQERIGPKRITQAGVLSFKQVVALATLFFGFAFCLGIPLVVEGGFPIVVIGLISIAMGYAYTGGPFPLAYLGLGDLFVILFFGLIAVMGMIFLQGHVWNLDGFILGLQIGFHATVLIAINNLRDREGDEKNHKKTLAVRLGVQKSRLEIYALLLLPFVLNIYWLVQGYKWVFVLGLIALPLAVKLILNVRSNQPGPIYNKFLAQSAGVHLLFGLGVTAGFFL